MENFDQILLTEEETAEALRAGREKKFYILKQIEYRKRLTEQFKVKTYTTQELYDIVSLQYDIDDDNLEVVAKLCQYFSGDGTFNGDLGKGLLLIGPVGVGKTSLMKFFIKNQRFSYRVESCRDIEAKYGEMGDNYIDKCSFNSPISSNGDPFGHQVIGLCFDDLGTEGNAKYYGKEKNVMAEIILNRYDNQLPFISTHITSNLPTEQIKEIYGSRVTDRLRQMVNIIQFPVKAKSRRK